MLSHMSMKCMNALYLCSEARPRGRGSRPHRLDVQRGRAVRRRAPAPASSPRQQGHSEVQAGGELVRQIQPLPQRRGRCRECVDMCESVWISPGYVSCSASTGRGSRGNQIELLRYRVFVFIDTDELPTIDSESEQEDASALTQQIPLVS